MVEQKEIAVPQNVPEELKEVVRQRIENSNEKYKARKAKQDKQIQLRKELKQERHAKRQEFRKLIEAGNNFFDENKDRIVNGKIELSKDFEIAYAVMRLQDQSASPKEFYLCRGAYTIKAPTDKWDDNIARGLCGYRLQNSTEWTITMPIPAMIFDSAHNLLAEAIKGIIKSRIIFLAPEIPQRITNVMFKDLQYKHKNRNKIDTAISLAAKALDEQNWKEAERQTILAVKLAYAGEEALKEGLSLIAARKAEAEGKFGSIDDIIGSLIKARQRD